VLVGLSSFNGKSKESFPVFLSLNPAGKKTAF
jgi:hypothetical protein